MSRLLLLVTLLSLFVSLATPVGAQDKGDKKYPEKGQEKKQPVPEPEPEPEPVKEGLSVDDLLEQRYQAKLDRPFAKAIPWEDGFEKALVKARNKKLPVLAYFTRSYSVCRPCNELEAGALVSDWWIRESTKFVPYLNIMARMKDKPDQELFYEKGGRSFPYLVVMDLDGEVQQVVNVRSANVLRAKVESVQGVIDAQVLLDAGDPTGKSHMILARGLLNPREADWDAMEGAAQTANLDAKILSRYNRFIQVRPIKQALNKLKRKTARAGNSQQRVNAEFEAQDSLLALHKEGLDLKDSTDPLFFEFWTRVCKGAVRAKDAMTARKILTRLEEAAGKDEEAQQQIARLKTRVAKTFDKPAKQE